MDENRKPRKKAGEILAVVLLLLLLPVLYVASIGPAFALAADGKISVPTYRALYDPIDSAAKFSRPTHWALRAYQHWWEDRDAIIGHDGHSIILD